MNDTEKKTVGKMIYLYCAAKHGTSHALCSECDKLYHYAQRRLSSCKFGEDKPTCEKCPVHCYSSPMRDKIKQVMRFSGPRMLFRYPVLAIRHLIKNLAPNKIDTNI